MADFAVRTVKNGAVKINHRVYEVSEQHMKYDGRLDGLRFAFGLYKNDTRFVLLWGTEQEFLSDDVPEPRGPHIVNGALPWTWWNEKG